MAPLDSKKKRCTDVLWLFLFILFWVLLILVAGFTIFYGNYLAYVNGYDTFGNICGLSYNTPHEGFPLSGMDTSQKSKVISFEPLISIAHVIRLCVEDCPQKTTQEPNYLIELSAEFNLNLCRYDFNMTKLKGISKLDAISYMDALGPCPRVIFDSAAVGYYCTPLFDHLPKDVKKNLKQPVFLYVYLARYYIAAISGFAFILCQVLLFAMRWLPYSFSTVICILVTISNAGLCGMLWYVFLTHENDTEEVNDPQLTEKTSRSRYYIEELDNFLLNREVIYVTAILCSVVTETLIIVISFFGKKFTQTKDVFKEVLSCLLQLPGLILKVLSIVSLEVAFVLVWSYVMLCMTTASYPEVQQVFPVHDEDGLDFTVMGNYSNFRKIEYVEARTIRSLYWINIIWFLWTTEFIFACERFLIAHSVAQWYFIRSTQSSASILIKYHLGSMAKGSLLSLPFGVLRFLVICLKAMLNMFKRLNTKTLESLEKYLGLWSGSTYAVIALKNLDFYSAGRLAQNTFKTYPVDVTDLFIMADWVMFLAKLVVASISAVIAIFLLKDDINLHTFMAPVAYITMSGFYMAHVVFLLFDVVKETLFLLSCGELNELNGKKTNISGIFGKFQKSGSLDHPEHIQVFNL